MSATPAPTTEARARRLHLDLPTLALGLGALLGVLLAAREVVTRGPELPSDAVALVGDVAITQAEFASAVAAERAGAQGPVDAAARAQILNRLVDEELLVQHALALDLVRRDRRVRGDLIETLRAELGGDAGVAETLRALRQDTLVVLRPPP